MVQLRSQVTFTPPPLPAIPCLISHACHPICSYEIRCHVTCNQCCMPFAEKDPTLCQLPSAPQVVARRTQVPLKLACEPDACMCMRACACVHVCIFAQMHACTRAPVHTCTHAHVHTCSHAHMVGAPIHTCACNHSMSSRACERMHAVRVVRAHCICSHAHAVIRDPTITLTCRTPAEPCSSPDAPSPSPY